MKIQEKSTSVVLGFLIAAVFLLPSSAGAASIAELQAQLTMLLGQLTALQGATAPAPTANSCPNLSRNLGRGAKGADVTALQNYLTGTGDYTYGEITGYFGAVTESAVQRFQTRNGIVSSGTPSTTGYGAVGPATRRAIAAACTTTADTPPAPNAPLGEPNNTSGLDALLADIDALINTPDPLDVENVDEDDL